MNQPLTSAEIRNLIAPRFQRHNPQGIYLANHSLGRPLDATADDVAEFLNLWYEKLDGAWEPWLEEVHRFGRRVGDLLQMPPGGAVVLKTAAGQALRTVLNSFAPRKIRVICSSTEFDSFDFILRTYESRGLVELVMIEPPRMDGPVPLFESEPFIQQLRRGADLLVISEVNFVSGQVFPELDRVLNIATESGVRSVLDCYHGFGVLDRPWPDADFAVGGSYKYVHGGPGACWLAVSPRIMSDDRFRPIDTGWFAKRELFGYDRSSDRATDERAWWESTPPVICVYQARAGLNYLAEIGVGRLRATNLAQQKQLQQAFADCGLPMHAPADPSEFGAFSLLPARDTARIVDGLRERGIHVDARQGFIRFGPHPLNTEEEFRLAAAATRELWDES